MIYECTREGCHGTGLYGFCSLCCSRAILQIPKQYKITRKLLAAWDEGSVIQIDVWFSVTCGWRGSRYIVDEWSGFATRVVPHDRCLACGTCTNHARVVVHHALPNNYGWLYEKNDDKTERLSITRFW